MGITTGINWGYLNLFLENSNLKRKNRTRIEEPPCWMRKSFKGFVYGQNLKYFSDSHFVCEITEKVKIATILDAIDTTKYSQIAFWDKLDKYKFVNFSDEFFSFVSLNKNNYPDVKEKMNKNLAVVNSKYKSQCFLDNDKYCINLFGKTYEVLDFYQELEGDEYTVCYINVWSDFARDMDCNTYLAVDTTDETIANIIKENIKDANITWWNGKEIGVIQLTDMYFYVVLLCGLILCVNCIGFANMWIKSYKSELYIRRMVGANPNQIHTFILKEYLKIYSVALVVGVFISKIIFFIFKNVKQLVHIRAIFGEGLHFYSVLFATGSVLLITLLVVEIRFRIINEKKAFPHLIRDIKHFRTSI